MRIIFFTLIIFSFLFSNDIKIEKNFFIDKSNLLNFKEVLKLKNKFKTIEKENLGRLKNPIWLSFKLKNESGEKIKKRFYNKRATVDYIEVYVLKKNKLINTYFLGDMLPYKKRDNLFRASYVDLEFESYDEISVFIKQESFSKAIISWSLIDIENFDKYYFKQTFFFTFIVGMFTITTLVAFILAIYLKSFSYFLYGCFNLTTIMYQISRTGMLYELEIPLYLNTIITYSGSILSFVFLSLFPLYFFNIKKRLKYFSISLKFLSLFGFLFAILFLFYPFNENILYLIKYSTLIILVNLFILTFLGIRIIFLKVKGSFFYFAANLSLLIFISPHLGPIHGLIDLGTFYNYSISVGTIIQDLLLLVSLIYTTILVKRENDNNKALLNEYSKLTVIGQTMINIYHQWKSPVNNISASLTHIEVAKEFKSNNLDKIINDNLKIISNSVDYIHNTAFLQLDFYKNNEKKENINLYVEIKSFINLIKNEFDKKLILIDINCDTSLNVYLEKTYLYNVLMILMENSFKVFEKRKIIAPFIRIKIEYLENQVIFYFQDNGGGIEKNIINNIFDKNFSFSNSTGLGLYMAKDIIEKKLNGQIYVKNKKDGCQFKIIINI